MNKTDIRVISSRDKIDTYEFKTTDENKKPFVLNFETQGIEHKKQYLQMLKIFRYTLAGILKEKEAGNNVNFKSHFRMDSNPLLLNLKWENAEDCKYYLEIVMCAIGELSAELAPPVTNSNAGQKDGSVVEEKPESLAGDNNEIQKSN